MARVSVTLHLRAAGSKSGLELDKVGGIYCPSHMKQRINAAGGPNRASDRAALLASEPLFVRDAIKPHVARLSPS